MILTTTTYITLSNLFQNYPKHLHFSKRNHLETFKQPSPTKDRTPSSISNQASLASTQHLPLITTNHRESITAFFSVEESSRWPPVGRGRGLTSPQQMEAPTLALSQYVAQRRWAPSLMLTKRFDIPGISKFLPSCPLLNSMAIEIFLFNKKYIYTNS